MTSGREPVIPTRMRAAIARRMAKSKQQAPHFYVTTEIEMDAVLEAVALLNQGRPREERVSLTAFLVRALAEVLPRHPLFNAVWREDGALERVEAVNIGVAVAVEDGLIAPAPCSTAPGAASTRSATPCATCWSGPGPAGCEPPRSMTRPSR
jgi:pyruvate/2-oxoglutarate dehydrogenase complex dihydrolipoamide acyltransferase (E2) component